jgi:hypothetical protein
VANEIEQEAAEYWVRHLPTGTLSPVGELDLERFEADPDYEFLEGHPSDVLATSWEIYEGDRSEGGSEQWYVRPHGSIAGDSRGPYKTEATARAALTRSEGDVEIVVTPAGPGAEPPTDE